MEKFKVGDVVTITDNKGKKMFDNVNVLKLVIDGKECAYVNKDESVDEVVVECDLAYSFIEVCLYRRKEKE